MKDCIICRCEGVYLSDIYKSIEEGGSSIPGLKARTRVGMGFCQGRVCQPVIKEILNMELEENIKPYLQSAKRPVRPTLLKEFK